MVSTLHFLIRVILKCLSPICLFLRIAELFVNDSDRPTERLYASRLPTYNSTTVSEYKWIDLLLCV